MTTQPVTITFSASFVSFRNDGVPRFEAHPERQSVATEWAIAAFTYKEATDLKQRALRLLEEAYEGYQACDGDPVMARKLLDEIDRRPVGTIFQELGGIGVTAMVLAQAAGVDFDNAVATELERVLSKPIEHFTKRNAKKNAKGFLAV
jgi:hypothetical protein